MKRTLKNVFSPSLCFVILRCPYAYGCLNKSGTVEKSFFVIPKPINEEGKKRRFYLPPNRGFLRSVFIGRQLTPPLLRQESMHNATLGPV